MTILAWIAALGSFLGGLGLYGQPAWASVANGLFCASILCCPLIWESDMARDFMPGKQRLMACLALLLALPLVLLPA